MLHKVIRTPATTNSRSLLTEKDGGPTDKESKDKSLIPCHSAADVSLTHDNNFAEKSLSQKVKDIKKEAVDEVSGESRSSESTLQEPEPQQKTSESNDLAKGDSNDEINNSHKKDGHLPVNISQQVKNGDTSLDIATEPLPTKNRSGESDNISKHIPDKGITESSTSSIANCKTSKETEKVQSANVPRSLLQNQEGANSEQQGTLSMVVEDEEVKPFTIQSIPIYLSQIPLKNKKAGRKRKVEPLDLDGIEKALFPDHQYTKSEAKKKKKKTGKGSKKGQKQKTKEIEEPSMDPEKGECSEENHSGEQTVKEKAELYPDPEFNYETFFDTDSEDEERAAQQTKVKRGRWKTVRSDDSDWEPGAAKSKTGTRSQDLSSEIASEEDEAEYIDSEEEVEQELYECDKCEATFNDCWASMCAHLLKEHPRDETTTCDLCDASCDTESELHEHLKDVHDIKGFSERKLGHYFCKNCSEMHLHSLSYIFHREEKHESCLLYCKQCKFVGDYRYQMKAHMKTAHSKTDFSEYVDNFTLTKTKAKRTRFVKRGYQNSCFMCGESMQRHLLSEHKKEKHAEALDTNHFECIVCSKVSSNHISMMKHYDTHFPSIQCSMCPQKFLHCDKKYLSHIERRHCGIKQEYCADCNLILSARTALKVHVRQVHGNKRGLLCSTCGRGFKNAYSLQIHNLIHTGEKPIKCELCDYRCRQKTALDWHMTKKHPSVAPPVNEKYKELPGRPKRKANSKKNSNVKQPKAPKA